jgi:cell filamentation protein
VSADPPAFGRSARERRAHAKHYYEGTEVLRNLADVRDAAMLELFERRRVTLAARRRQPMRALTYDEFKGVHRVLFREVYAWAGQIRDYSTGRGSAPFCLPEFIDVNMERIFAAICNADGLRNLTAEAFAQRAADVVNEINAVHPFIEGNGRTSREFLKDLAAHAGHPIDMARFDRASWYAAAARGFEAGDHAPMRDCIRAALIRG